MSKWISVEERLPRDDEMVCENGFMVVLAWNGAKYDINGYPDPDKTRAHIQEYATHWMPLPDPPERVE